MAADTISRPGTYLDMVLDLLASGGDRAAMVYRRQRVSCVQAHEAVLRTANALWQCGLDKGKAVAILVGNRPESIILHFAIHLIGCRLVFVPHELGMAQLAALVKHAEADAFIFDQELGSRAEELARQAPAPVVFSLGPTSIGENLLELAAAAPPTRPDVAISPEDIVTLLYSGGTTGIPKLATHGHNIYQGLVEAAPSLRGILPGTPRTLVCTLTTHTSGCVSTLMTLLAEGTLVLADSSFDAGEVIRRIDEEQITFLVLLPPMLYELLDHPACPQNGFPSIKRIFYGGAPTAPRRLLAAIERFGPVLRQGYGLAEVPSVTALEPEEHDVTRPERLRSCGRPVPGTQIEVRDSDGESLSVAEVGEVYVRSPMVTGGYWRDREQTDEQIDRGWLRTGDLGYLDEDGYLYLVDRSKDVIVPGSLTENVFSRLLDDFLTGLPGVRHAAAVGSPDCGHGEAVHVFLVPEPGADLDPAVLREQVVDSLGKPYRPESFIIVDALPLTQMGKIDKKALRTRLAGPTDGPVP
jgi:fatty-acyl-CoA synthase